MLHMIVATHGPETCGLVNPEAKEKTKTMLERLEPTAKDLGMMVHGHWVNVPSHVIFFLVDAPNAHVVNRFTRDIQLMEWNTVVVHPVLSAEEMAASRQH